MTFVGTAALRVWPGEVWKFAGIIQGAMEELGHKPGAWL